MTRRRLALVLLAAAGVLAAALLAGRHGGSPPRPRLGDDGCLTASTRAARFPLRADRPSPLCRHALGGTVDVPLSGRRDASGGYDPDPPCGAEDPARGCLPAAFGQGNARIRRARLAGGGLVAVSDSFDRPFAYVRSVTPGCFDVFDRARRRVGTTDPRRDGQHRGCDPTRASRARVDLELQGRGCMITRRLQRAHVVVGLVPAPDSPVAPRNTGLRGFVAASALADDLSPAERRHLRDADPGCGRASVARPQRAATELIGGGQLHTADDFVDRPPPSHPTALDRYVSPRNLRCRDAPAACSGFYANYQGPCFAPDVALLAVSTTAVSGVGSTPRDNPAGARTGGVVRAIVARDGGRGSFRALDAMGAPDANVPRAQGPIATWVFGDADPGADVYNRAHPALAALDRRQHVYGWTAVRRPRVPSARYACR